MSLVRFRRGDILIDADIELGRWVYAAGPSFPGSGLPPPHDAAVFFRTDLSAHYVWDEATATWNVIASGAADAPADAEYAVAAPNGSLSAARVLTDSATVTWDFGTPGEIKANAAAAPTTEVWTTNTPAEIGAQADDYDPGPETVQRVSSDAARDITGLMAEADGTYKRITNVGAQNIRLRHQHTDSDAENRFICAGGASITLTPGAEADGWYDGVTERWRVSLVG